MKCLVFFLFSLGVTCSFFTINTAYGLWMPLSPEDLLQQSATIFVGTITAIELVDVEYQSQIAQDGTIKENIGPEILPLEEYTVDVEKFLKNPQETNIMKVLRATVSGVPTGPSKISGFEVGDRVLFYLPKDEKQTHFAGQYLPESFQIPKQCDVYDVLKSKRIDGRNYFTKIQNGVEIKDNFTSGIPIQFSYDRDVGTLFGQIFEVSVGINKVSDNVIKNVFQKTILVDIDPCKWTGSAQWSFVPQEGEYRLNMHVSTDGGGSGSSTRFFAVASDEKLLESPLKQFQTGIIQWDSRCYSTHDVATVTVIDQDMNVDSNVPDQFQITVWSDWIEEETGESKILPVNVIETGNSTGVFESLVFLGSAYDETSGHRIPVGIENTIFAKYVDYTVPYSNELNIMGTTSAKILSIGGSWDRWEELSSLYDIPLVYDPCLKKQMGLVGTGDDFAQLDIFYPSPLKQIDSGLYLYEIKCKDNFVKIIKQSNTSPACVTYSTGDKLLERGWATCDDEISYGRGHPCGIRSSFGISSDNTYEE